MLPVNGNGLLGANHNVYLSRCHLRASTATNFFHLSQKILKCFVPECFGHVRKYDAAPSSFLMFLFTFCVLPIPGLTKTTSAASRCIQWGHRSSHEGDHDNVSRYSTFLPFLQCIFYMENIFAISTLTMTILNALL